MVARLEYGPQSPNPRFVISSRYDDGFKLYYKQYCARGDMENRIKDQQLGLFADRTSSTQLDDRAPPGPTPMGERGNCGWMPGIV